MFEASVAGTEEKAKRTHSGKWRQDGTGKVYRDALSERVSIFTLSTNTAEGVRTSGFGRLIRTWMFFGGTAKVLAHGSVLWQAVKFLTENLVQAGGLDNHYPQQGWLYLRALTKLNPHCFHSLLLAIGQDVSRLTFSLAQSRGCGGIQ